MKRDLGRQGGQSLCEPRTLFPWGYTETDCRSSFAGVIWLYRDEGGYGCLLGEEDQRVIRFLRGQGCSLCEKHSS